MKGRRNGKNRQWFFLFRRSAATPCETAAKGDRKSACYMFLLQRKEFLAPIFKRERNVFRPHWSRPPLDLHCPPPLSLFRQHQSLPFHTTCGYYICRPMVARRGEKEGKIALYNTFHPPAVVEGRGKRAHSDGKRIISLSGGTRNPILANVELILPRSFQVSHQP